MDFESQLLKHRLYTLVSNGMKISDTHQRKSYKKNNKEAFKKLLHQYQKSKPLRIKNPMIVRDHNVSTLVSVVKSTSKISL